MVELGQVLGEHRARVLTVAVDEGAEDDHGVAAVGHDEMEPVEGEVGGDQRTVNLGCTGRSVSRTGAKTNCTWAETEGCAPSIERGSSGGDDGTSSRLRPEGSHRHWTIADFQRSATSRVDHVSA